jgi:flagellar biosynthesis/type III secretory pathway protein FliH
MPARVLSPVLLADPATGTLVPLGVSAAEPMITGAVCRASDSGGREQILEQALAELQQRWNDREQAHQEETQAAEERGAAAVRLEVAAAVQHLTVIVDTLRTQHEEIFRAAEETVVRLSVAIAQRIVGDTVRVDDAVVLTTVRRALEHAAEAQRVNVHVHPSDLQLVEQHASGWAGLTPRARTVRFQADPHVGRGGCVVETESGHVIADLDEQLRTLEAALVERVR